MPLPERVKIVEVGPRDGLQNEAHFVATDTKVAFINLLSQTGLRQIEVTSFVSPSKIPQLADNQEVYRKIDKHAGIQYSALVPNIQGLNNAITAGVEEIAVFAAASESFSKRNINCSINESLDRFHRVAAVAKKQGLRIRGYISCVLGCPYEGAIHPHAVANVAKQLYQLGCDEICLGDTIGIGTAKQTQNLIASVSETIPIEQLAMHFHDTYGQAIANIYASLECGITTFDSSVAGLGGCPYAKGASGNVATEDVLFLLNGLNINTGVDIFKVIAAGDFISSQLKRPTQSKVAKVLHRD